VCCPMYLNVHFHALVVDGVFAQAGGASLFTD
jgi:hypothetical protein